METGWRHVVLGLVLAVSGAACSQAGPATSSTSGAAATTSGGALTSSTSSAAPSTNDGLSLSTDPYRYLGGSTAAPTSASETVTVTDAAGAQTMELSTSESPPQATIVYSTNSFSAPAGERIVLRIAPVPPPAEPERGRIDGNVYSFTASRLGPGGAHQAVDVAAGQVVTLALRATKASGAPTLNRLDSGTWRPIATTEVPPSEYSVSTDRLGDFALVVSG